jgi:hypothetical protein
MKVDHGGVPVLLRPFEAVSKLDAIAWSSPHQGGEVNGGRFASRRIDLR